MTHLSRRSFLTSSAVLLAPVGARAAASTAPSFPSQEPQLVEEMVVVAHGNVARVKELVSRQPTLAKATWDWGFGDWETALGAASHVGNREIAELVLVHGAHPTIFSAAMLGQLDVVKAFVAAAPGVQRTRGPHSISLLRHAAAGGPRAQPVVEYLKSIEGADDALAEKPLSDADITKLAGVYTFGVTPADRIEITVNKTQLQFGRPGRFPRGLFHLGSYQFCPMGAEDVRIRFSEAGGATILTVHDPDVILTATKTG
jgi:hypothetical protein